MLKKILAVILFAVPLSAEEEKGVPQPFELTLPEHMYVEEVPGVAVSPDESILYVFNRGQHALLVLDRSGGYKQEIGAGLFKVPHGLRVDAEGNIWTTDVGNHLVLKFSPAGKILMVLGKKNTAATGWHHKDYNQTFLNKPSDIAFDKDGNIYVADGGNYRIVKYAPDGTVLATFGKKGADEGQFNFPHSLVVDNKDRLLVADRENKRIQLFDLKGKYLEQWDGVGYPYMLALSGDGALWMTDARVDQLVKLTLEGDVVSRTGQSGKALGRYGFLHGVVPMREGALVSDILNWRLELVKF